MREKVKIENMTIRYEKREHGLRILSIECPSEVKKLIIPSSINGVPVKSLGAKIGKHLPSCDTLVIPDTVGVISGESPFAGAQNIRKIIWPGSVEVIPARCFMFSDVQEIILPEGLDSIGTEAFYECPNLSKVNIPDSVSFIGTGAFNGCQKLTSVRWSSSLKHIPAHCFEDTSLSIMENIEHVKRIDEMAFAYSDMGSINMFSSIESIGPSAFIAASFYDSIEVPTSCRTIKSKAFCKTKLNKIVLCSSKINICEDSFPIDAEIDASNVTGLFVSQRNKRVPLKIKSGFDTVLVEC